MKGIICTHCAENVCQYAHARHGEALQRSIHLCGTGHLSLWALFIFFLSSSFFF